jgi:hypothetical protein
MQKQIIYYTDSRLEEELDEAVRKQILKASKGIPVISVSQRPLDFGNNICVGLKPCNYLSLYEQLLTGLKAAQEDSIIYLCEHDVFYHPSHFDYIPPRESRIYYNLHRYYYKRGVDFFLQSIGKRALSQAVAHRNVLFAHAQEQVQARLDGIASPCMGPFDNFSSEYPNIDVRHGGNLSQFGEFDKSDRSPQVFSVPFWGTPRRFMEKVDLHLYNVETERILNDLLNSDNKPSPVTIKISRVGLANMFKELQFTRGAEIGVKRGHYSLELCEAIPNLKLLCIDDYVPTPKFNWDTVETFYVVARKKLAGYDATFIKKSSMQAAKEDVPDHSLDFVYIDADHGFDNIMKDIIVWSNKVRPGGVISGHDYDIADVKSAVDMYAEIHGHTVFVTHSGESSPSWFFAKKL